MLCHVPEMQYVRWLNTSNTNTFFTAAISFKVQLCKGCRMNYAFGHAQTDLTN